MKTAQIIVLVSTLLTIPTSANAAPNNIVTTIWNYPSRSITEIGSWFSKDIPVTPKVVDTSTKILGVQDLTAVPVVEDSVAAPDLTNKLDSSSSVLEKLSSDYQLVLGETVLMGLNWETLTVSDVTASIDKQNATLTNTEQSLDWLERAWGWSQTDTLRTQINTVKSDLATVRSITTSSGMLPVAYNQLKSTIKELEAITAQVGDKTDKPSAVGPTLFDKFNQVKDSAAQLDSVLSDLSINSTDLRKLDAEVAAVNSIPHSSALISKDTKNHVFDLIGLVKINKMLLANDKGQTVMLTWPEESGSGTVIFKTLVVNPSLLNRQEVGIKYYLPPEVKEADVLALDAGLQSKLDAGLKQYYIEGSAVVAANDSRTVSVETKDVWQFDPNSLNSAVSQSESLIDSMAGLSIFTKAIALKGNINADVARIQTLQLQQATLDQRITNYRQISLLEQDLNSNLVQLQQLSKSENSTAGSDFSSWQEVAIMLAGAVCLMMGLSMLSTVRMQTDLSHKSKAKLHRINVFSTSGIATSDL